MKLALSSDGLRDALRGWATSWLAKARPDCDWCGRIEEIADSFDHIVVAFSGGKDSLAVLELTREVLERKGRLPVNAVFMDEELIADSIVNFVDEIRQKDWCRLLWMAVPLRSHKYILGKTIEYVQFDPNREWVRQPPPWAFRLPEGDTWRPAEIDGLIYGD